jgi:hypothetical protein
MGTEVLQYEGVLRGVRIVMTFSRRLMESAADGQMSLGATAGIEPSVNYILKQTDYGSWFWLLFLVVVFSFLWYGLASIGNVAEIKNNWAKYRCSPSVMPFASIYGHNTAENFTYCMKNIFNDYVGFVTAPFVTLLSGMASIMSKFLENLNSLRMMGATLVGGVSKVIQEFFDRMKYLNFQVRQSITRIKFLMGRVMGTFYAVIYMGMSAVTSGLNFGDTVIFKFLDTFCFPPETPIVIDGAGEIQLDRVRVGDRISGGGVVTSVYRFYANGQPMVLLGDIEVSTNHFVEYEGRWIPAKDHPEAKEIHPWSGGALRPLVCLDVSDHRIPLGDYVFSDWDETSDTDQATMILAEQGLNAGHISNMDRPWLYQPAIHGDVKIRMADRSTKAVRDIRLNDCLEGGGIVTGTGYRVVPSYCRFPSGEIVTPSQLIWSEKSSQWIRAGHLFPVITETQFLNILVVMKTSQYKTESGITLRDMCEIHSPDMEGPTATVLKGCAEPDKKNI